MKRLPAALIAAALIGASVRAGATDWGALHEAWKAYYLHASSRTAKAVADLLPAAGSKDPADAGSADVRSFVFDNLDPLASEAAAADAESMRFRLYAIATARQRVALDIILATSIEKDPVLFLRQLSAHRALVPDLVDLVSSTGDPDDLGELTPKEILRRRIRALSRVKDRKLAKLRDACVRALENAI
jgi:hypothetical protein